MDSKEIQSLLEEHIELLADLEHQRWAHWQSYLHSKCYRQADGSLVIPSELAQRWERQIETDYAQLSEDEKESDRELVRNYIGPIAFLLSQKVE